MIPTTDMSVHEHQPAQRQRVQSSCLTSVGYQAASRTLEVEFRNGSVYRYFEVPACVHEALIEAPSKGRFFATEVRDRFACARPASLRFP